MVARGRAISALQADLLADIAEFDRAEGWRGDGAVSMVAWVTEECRVSAATARQWVRAAARLGALPGLAEGLASGQLPLDLVAPLAEVATEESDATLASAAEHWSVKQAGELVEWHKAELESAAGADGAAAREYEFRSLRFNDARQTMWMAFTKDDYAEAKAAVKSFMDSGGSGVDGVGVTDPVGYIPFDQRLYDALMDLFRVGGVPKRGTSSRPTVVVHAPLSLLMGSKGAGVAAIQGVGPISAGVARRLACDADITFSVERADGSILDQGRARRDPTTAQRIEIARRDKGCRFPGCCFADFTHVHHVTHWVKGGQTNQDNLITLCGRHHRAVHELGWKMKGSADDVMTFRSPHGREMTSVPSPTWRGARVPLRR